MRYTSLRHFGDVLILATSLLAAVSLASAQSEVQTRTLVINGHRGEALIYRINNQSFIDLETIARIAHGSVSFQADQITLTLPSADAEPVSAGAPHDQGMTRAFMAAAIQNLAVIKDWQTTMARAIQTGTPGDGSRLIVFHDRAAEGLRLATVDATSRSDRDALQLLTNHFNQVDRWWRKLVDARKSMSTANYSITPNALDNDPDYQKIRSCSQFLSTMLPSGQYKYDSSCQ